MVELHVWEFPLSIILAIAFVIAVFIFDNKAGKSKALSFMRVEKCSAPLLIIIALFMAVEGTWKLHLYRHWSFIAVILLCMFCLGLATLDALRKKKSHAFILNHFGFFLILFGGFFGAPDVLDAQMAVDKRTPSQLAFTLSGEAVPLPFKTELKEFTIDYYNDSVSPKQFSSTLVIDGKTLTTSVNHPAFHSGYLIYQSDYDKNGMEYSVLKIVKDPWFPIVLLGMIMMIAGSLFSLKKTWNSKAVLPATIVLAILFGAISLMKINFGTLMPALRSIWFVPHIIIYMLAYSVLAISLTAGFLSLAMRGKKAGQFAVKSLSTASSLLLTGMLFGAIWAKAAWGDYWTWDGKECWAAVTWMLSLLGSHIPQKRNRTVVAIILLAFLSMQITWYGVNYLPSSPYSLHTYNQ